LTGLETEYQLRLAAEQALSRDIRQLFTVAERDTLRRFLRMYGDPDILQFEARQILSKWYDIEKQYTDTILYHDIEAFRRGRRNTLDLINLQVDKPNQYRLFDFSQAIYDNLTRQTFVASARTMARVRDNIMSIISQSYQEGIGIQDAARRLKKEFATLNDYETRRIARTEINSAQNVGNYQTYFDYDINYHQWWTGQDARVRTSHKEIHGQIVKVGTKFSNGLLFPGDRNGPIKEWIHCRCTTVPYLMPLGFMAPPGMSTFRESDIIRIPSFDISKLEI
jgi:SPP1 gp7 family putative phage head morphogenesis protein